MEQTNDIDLDALDVWERTQGYSTIKVAVLDSGIQLNHPDLNVAGGRNFTDAGDPDDYAPTATYESHGTTVAGVINSTINNNIGVMGLTPNVEVLSLKIGTNYDSSGGFSTHSQWIVNAINYAAEEGCRVTNCSNGFFWVSSSITAAYVNTRNANGVVHMASSGNFAYWLTGLSFPASSEGVVAVGSIQSSGVRVSSSQYGEGLDVVMPGSGIWTTDRTGSAGYDASDYVSANGTSFASPLAAAAAAAIISKNPSLTAEQVENALFNTARDLGNSGYDTTYGHGLIDVVSALDSVEPSIFYAAGFEENGNASKKEPTFGIVYDIWYPYYYSQDHQWQWPATTDPSNYWLWDYNSADYWWTTIGPSGMYPYIYRNSDNTWYLYEIGSRSPRRFKNVDTGEWVNF